MSGFDIFFKARPESSRAAREALSSAVTQGRPAHAYILQGAKGTGKFALALEAAAELLLGQGASRSPEKLELLRTGSYHPDLKLLDPDTATISVEDIRSIVSDVARRPYAAERKVYILCDAGRMNESAQNALLKTLEEPPAYAVFFLLVTEASLLRPTIRSRCVCLSVEPMERGELLQCLRENYAFRDSASIEFAARMAGGSLGRALELLEGDSSLASSISACNELLDAVLTVDRGRLYGSIMTRRYKRPELFTLLELFKSGMMDLIRLRLHPSCEPSYFSDREAAERYLSAMTLRQLMACYQACEESCENLWVSNANTAASLAEFIIKVT